MKKTAQPEVGKNHSGFSKLCMSCTNQNPVVNHSGFPDCTYVIHTTNEVSKDFDILNNLAPQWASLRSRSQEWYIVDCCLVVSSTMESWHAARYSTAYSHCGIFCALWWHMQITVWPHTEYQLVRLWMKTLDSSSSCKAVLLYTMLLSIWL